METKFTILNQEHFDKGRNWARAYSREALINNALGHFQNGIITQDELNGFCHELMEEDKRIIEANKR